jgi:hypothetical protein
MEATVNGQLVGGVRFGYGAVDVVLVDVQQCPRGGAVRQRRCVRCAECRRRDGVVLRRILEVPVLTGLVDPYGVSQERVAAVRRLLEEEVRVEGVVAVLGDEFDVEGAASFHLRDAELVG